MCCSVPKQQICDICARSPYATGKLKGVLYCYIICDLKSKNLAFLFEDIVFLCFLCSFSKNFEVLRAAKSFPTGVHRELRCTGSVGHRGAAVLLLLL